MRTRRKLTEGMARLPRSIGRRDRSFAVRLACLQDFPFSVNLNIYKVQLNLSEKNIAKKLNLVKK